MAPSLRFVITALLVTAASCHPQYPDDPSVQVGPSSVDIPTHASDGSVLTDGQKDALQQFYDQVEGVFGSDAPAVGVGGAGPPDLSCGYNHQCVPYFQCDKKGVIITDGEGLIDVRVRPQGDCINPEFPGIPALCCLEPDKCFEGDECVDPSLCSATGVIITDGSGILDLRTGKKGCVQYDNRNGVCCTPPKQYVNCPPDSACIPNNECKGRALGDGTNFYDYIASGSWQECSLPYSNTGVCCIQPPVYLQICPHNSVCLAHGHCSGTALDPYDAFVDYFQSGSWQECATHAYNGVCCKQPPLDYCSLDGICLHQDKCYTTALDQYNNYVDYTSIDATFATCNVVGGQGYGVCCSPPPVRYVDCIDSVCVDYLECEGKALRSDGLFSPFDPIGQWSECNLGHGYTESGVCCKKKLYPTPPNKCGIRNYPIDQRIQSYAKNEAAFGEFPWQTIIFHQNFTFKCGASLISERHVLTAAHCVANLHPGGIRLRMGEWKVSNFEEPLSYQDRNVKSIHIHPDYNFKNVHNDIAVLELIEPIPLEYHINTICLPGHNHLFYDGQECFTTGWGKDSFTGTFQHILKKIKLLFVDHYKCQSLLRHTRLGRYFILDDSFICAGGEANKDACYGDGGGPLVCKDAATQQYFLAGITSWGIGCGTKNVPGVYVDVKGFGGWIEDIVFGGHAGGGGPPLGYGK